MPIFGKKTTARAKRKIRNGVVVSCKMARTAVVEVERLYPHPFYHKVVRGSKKFKAHDEENKCRLGDRVEIMETRPLSRDKRWRVVKILGKGKVTAHELPKQKEKKVDSAAESIKSSG